MSKPRWLEDLGTSSGGTFYGRSGIRHTGGLNLAEECPRSKAGRLSTSRPQWANWKQEEPAGFDGGRQLSIDGTNRMNREVQVRNSVRGSE
jgi:hypothetical protein